MRAGPGLGHGNLLQALFLDRQRLRHQARQPIRSLSLTGRQTSYPAMAIAATCSRNCPNSWYSRSRSSNNIAVMAP